MSIVFSEALDYLRDIPSESVDCVFTDPPYNIGLSYEKHSDVMDTVEYKKWCRKWLHHCYRVLKPNGTIWVVINDENLCYFGSVLGSFGLIQRNIITWYYTFGVHCTTKFSRCKASILYYVKGHNFTWNRPLMQSKRQILGDRRAADGGKTIPDVWEIPRLVGNAKEREDYPCQLPLELVERSVLCSTNVGDVVMDPFLGTGTTAVACVKHNRIVHGCDNSRKALSITERRVREVTSE